MNKEKIMELVDGNNGMITTAMVVDAGISRGSLKYLVDKGMLEKSSRGVYILPEMWDDEFVNLQTRFKKGIFSGETVLFLNNLTDKTPNYFSMTFPASYNTQNVRCYHVHCTISKKSHYDLGIVDMKTPMGHTIKGYCIERCLCEILKSKSRTDIQTISEAFRRYVKRKDRNIPLLSEYAKLFKVNQKVQSYLEVLL